MSGFLTHSPARIIRQLFVDVGLGAEPVNTLTVWPVFSGREPDLPDNCITIRNTQGTSFGFTQTNGQLQEMHGIQVRIRGVTEEVAYGKARAIAVAMDESILDATVIVANSVYHVQSITRIGAPLDLGKEVPKSQRNLFTINATVVVSLTSEVPDDVIVTQEGEYIIVQ